MHIIPVTKENLSSPELAAYSERSEVQLKCCNEPAPGCFVAESLRVIDRALNAGYVPISLLIEERHREDALLRRCSDIPIYVGSEEQLGSISGYKLTGGALALMQRREPPPPEEIIDKAKRLVILEGINNPTNVGAIFRSAAALGAEAVLLSPDCSDPLYRRAARVSMGAVFMLPWTYFGESRSADVESLKRSGFCTVAMALCEGAIPLSQLSLPADASIAVFLGNENSGLSEATIAACDHPAVIPMQQGIDSLNVAAASAVVFWELFKDAV